MSAPTHFKCECQHCHGHIECPSEASGLTMDCPHCGKPTTLVAPAQSPTRSFSAKKILLIVVGAAFLAAALIVWAVHHAGEQARLREEAAVAARAAALKTVEAEARTKDPLALAGWQVSKILLEQSPGSTLVHAVGDLTNETDRQRFGVKIHLDLFNADNQKIGGATDYQPTVEPRSRWKFNALVVNSKAVSAKVAAVEESP